MSEQQWLSITPEKFDDREVVDMRIYKDGEWCYTEALYSYGSAINNEIGMYTTWNDDPSTNITLHYMMKNDEEVVCLIRQLGNVDWETVPLHSNKPFPFTDKKVKWFKVGGLIPNKIYETKLQGSSEIHRFKTMPSTFIRDINVSLISDNMNDRAQFNKESRLGFKMIIDKMTDVIVIAGDVVHGNGLYTDNWELFFDQYFKSIKKNDLVTPIVVAIGNHDGSGLNADGSIKHLMWHRAGARKSNVTFLYNFFSNLQDNGFGCIDIGNYMSLICLNSHHSYPVEGYQTEWLESRLIEREGKAIFPFFHVPPYPAWYGFNSTNSSGVRNAWTPLFTQYGVKIVGNGHEHAHIVTHKMTGDELDPNGVVYTGQGHGMGNVTRGLSSEEDTWFADYRQVGNKGIDFITFKTDNKVLLRKINFEGEIMYSKLI